VVVVFPASMWAMIPMSGSCRAAILWTRTVLPFLPPRSYSVVGERLFASAILWVSSSS